MQNLTSSTTQNTRLYVPYELSPTTEEKRI